MRPSCRYQVDYQLKLGRLLDWQIRRLGTFEGLAGVEPELSIGRYVRRLELLAGGWQVWRSYATRLHPTLSVPLALPKNVQPSSCRRQIPCAFKGEDMRRPLAAEIVSCLLVLNGCVTHPTPPPMQSSTQYRAARSVDVTRPAQPPVDNTVTLAAARRACAAQYPAAVGTFLARATCINEAIERIALPTATNPDLIQLQESARIALSTKLDDGTISQREAEATMAKIDAKVASIEHYRATSDQDAAASQLGVLNDLVASTN